MSDCYIQPAIQQLQNDCQNKAFRLTKGHVSGHKRPCSAMQNDTFCNKKAANGDEEGMKTDGKSRKTG